MDVTLSPSANRSFYVLNAFVSAAALGLLYYILVLHRGSAEVAAELSFMPAVNAGLNATAACFLTAGFIAIRRRAIPIHRACMMAAFAASSLFLVGYLSYHFVHGDTKFVGPGPLRAAYLVVLASHVLLSMTVLPLALTSFWFALRRGFVTHKKVARWTLPIWLYVSVTGVLIFFLLRGHHAT